MKNAGPTISQANPLRIALFDAGRHAQHYDRTILRCASTELVAVVDPSDMAQAAMRRDVAKLEAEVDLPPEN